ncbi:19110_t:CDS:1, partial [Gigaspora margarita]
FNNKFLQINVKAVNIKISNELAIEQFFDIGMLKQNQKDIIEENQIINSQRSTSNTNKDWSVDDIFFQYNTVFK